MVRRKRSGTRKARAARTRATASFKRPARRKAGSSRSRDLLARLTPLTTEEHVYSFVAGAAVGPVSNALKPLQQRYLGMFGTYSDEAAIGIAAALAHKHGGRLHKAVPKLAREFYRTAVMSAGQQAGQSTVTQIMGALPFGKNTTSTSTNGNVSAPVVVM